MTEPLELPVERPLNSAAERPTASLPDGSRRHRLPAGWIALVLALGVYFGTGFYTVPANEIAVVRRFGRAVWPMRTSGLHYDLPWPWSRLDRVNLNVVRTLTVGEATEEASEFLSPATTRPTTFLTGDRNLLQLRVAVNYRVTEEFLAEWLYATDLPDRRLQTLVESTVTTLVSQCGVDFVHTQGLAELNNRLLLTVRSAARQQRLGCEVEQVSIDRAEPPPRVKAEFLDVSNARADLARAINEARSYAEQKQAESQADAREVVDAAERKRIDRIAAAQGSAGRFVRLVNQIRQDSSQGGRTYQSSRSLTLNRLYLETVQDVLSRSRSKMILDGDEPADLMWQHSNSAQK